MHWEILIIPLIALGVWILGTLFKGEEERLKKNARRPGAPPRRTPRRPVTDLDRFLEEARLRREAEEKRKASPPPPLRHERPLRPREAPPRPARPTSRIEETPVAPPVVAEAVVIAPRPQTATQPSPPAPPPLPFAAASEVRVSPLLQQVRSLLSKPQTVGAAFVLREIFDRPLCMRRR